MVHARKEPTRSSRRCSIPVRRNRASQSSVAFVRSWSRPTRRMRALHLNKR